MLLQVHGSWQLSAGSLYEAAAAIVRVISDDTVLLRDARLWQFLDLGSRADAIPLEIFVDFSGNLQIGTSNSLHFTATSTHHDQPLAAQPQSAAKAYLVLAGKLLEPAAAVADVASKAISESDGFFSHPAFTDAAAALFTLHSGGRTVQGSSGFTVGGTPAKLKATTAASATSLQLLSPTGRVVLCGVWSIRSSELRQSHAKVPALQLIWQPLAIEASPRKEKTRWLLLSERGSSQLSDLCTW